MKTKYIKPEINITIIEEQTLMAASNPTGYIPTITSPADDAADVTSSDAILSKRYDAWGDE